MKYLTAGLLVLVLAGCADHHTLTTCSGPYASLPPPPAPTAGKPTFGLVAK